MVFSIRVVFTKNDNVEDDSILFYRKNGSEVQVNFREYTSITSLSLKREQAYLHLITTLKMLTFDKDPYTTVQFQFPGTPPILVGPTDFHKTPELLEHTMNLFGLTLMSWFSDEEESDSESDSDEDTSQQ